MSIVLDGSNGAGLTVVTTTQKLALTVSAGYIVFDRTLDKLCVYSDSAWQTVTSI